MGGQLCPSLSVNTRVFWMREKGERRVDIDIDKGRESGEVESLKSPAKPDKSPARSAAKAPARASSSFITL